MSPKPGAQTVPGVRCFMEKGIQQQLRPGNVGFALTFLMELLVLVLHQPQWDGRKRRRAVPLLSLLSFPREQRHSQGMMAPMG